MLIPINELRPSQFNKELFNLMPITDYSALKKDIEKSGIKVELHVLPDKTVICGHQRLQIAKELEIKELPCKIIDLKTEEEIKEYMIKDNLLRRHLSTEQKYLLYAELSKLFEKGKGFRSDLADNVSVGSVEELTAEALGNPKLAKTIERARIYSRIIKENPNLLGKPAFSVFRAFRIKDKLNKIKISVQDLKITNLFYGDAEKELIHLPSESVDLIIIDPPYNIEFKSMRGIRLNEFPDILPMDKFDRIIAELFRVLKSDRHFYCFIGFQTYGEYKRIIEKYFRVRNCLIWVKNNTLHDYYQLAYAHKYEMIIFAQKGSRPLNIAQSPDVLEFPDSIKTQLISAEKPVNLLEYLIKNSSFENELVLDCFAGSGSTLIAAENSHRNWIGIEINKDVLDIAKKRLNEVMK